MGAEEVVFFFWGGVCGRKITEIYTHEQTSQPHASFCHSCFAVGKGQ